MTKMQSVFSHTLAYGDGHYNNGDFFIVQDEDVDQLVEQKFAVVIEENIKVPRGRGRPPKKETKETKETTENPENKGNEQPKA